MFMDFFLESKNWYWCVIVCNWDKNISKEDVTVWKLSFIYPFVIKKSVTGLAKAFHCFWFLCLLLNVLWDS